MGSRTSKLIPGDRDGRQLIKNSSSQRDPKLKPPHPNEDITIQNSETSAFHALPAELLLQIDSYLEIRSRFDLKTLHMPRMALRATCRRFHDILPGPPAPENRWTTPDRTAYKHLMVLAEFRALCAKERDGLLSKIREEEVLVCCVCRHVHPKSCFTPQEQKKEPEKRTCIGDQGVLEICPHIYFTFLQLNVKPIHKSCSKCRQSVMKYGSIVKVNEQETKEVKIESIIDLGPFSKDFDKESVAGALNGADWRGCPHLHIRSVDSWLNTLLPSSSQITTQMLNSIFYRLKWSLPTFLPFNRNISKCGIYTCKVKDCDTRVTLLREDKKSRNMVCLQLQIERYLGKLSDGPNGKKWLSQIVEVSSLEDDKFLVSDKSGKTQRGKKSQQGNTEGD